jgi:hypothetical protein
MGFQACWEVVKADIMNVFHDFHGMFERSLSVTFVIVWMNGLDTKGGDYYIIQLIPLMFT